MWFLDSWWYNDSMVLEQVPNNQLANDEELKPKFSTRTVLFDADDKVAIINVAKHGYYKIPGGGVEENEPIEDAARREVKEEAGCDCELVTELGRLETPVPVWGMLDISDGYIARVVGEKSSPSYEDWENERGFRIEWFDSLDIAIETIANNVVSEPGMDCLQERDLTFLRLAKEKLEQE